MVAQKVKLISSVLLIMICAFTLQAQIPEKPEDISPLLIGESIPSSELLDENGAVVNLDEIIKAMPTVMVFYRGGWCPYCNRQLSGLVDSEEEIIKLGYQIIAISPDDFQNLKPTIKEDNLNYKIYADVDAQFIQKVGIAFKASSRTQAYITNKTIGKATEILPVPTVLILDTDGKILFEYISPNYKKRITSELLLAVLNELN